MAENPPYQAQSDELVGREINGLKILELLAEGGMGRVYLAHQGALKLPRAVKIVGSDHRGSRETHARFRREAEVLSRLHHHHIIQVLDFGEIDGRDLYIVMEFIDGVDAQELIDSEGPLSLLDGLALLRDVASAACYAHSQDVVHRDLKPGNIVLREGDVSQAKIIDFGLVKIVRDGPNTQLTQQDQIVGSPLYLAPEQAKTVKDLTGAVDVYALAGIAFFLFSGQPVFPWTKKSRPIDIMRAHCNEEPPRLSTRCPALQVPAFLDTLLEACLAKNPDERPSADELLSHLERLYTEERVKTHQATDDSVNS